MTYYTLFYLAFGVLFAFAALRTAPPLPKLRPTLFDYIIVFLGFTVFWPLIFLAILTENGEDNGRETPDTEAWPPRGKVPPPPPGEGTVSFPRLRKEGM